MKVSIVIVNWNTRTLLADCLTSIYGNPPTGAFEVLVVDNASTDGSVALVRHQFPLATLIVNEANVGFAAANNVGIRESKGEYILLLNSDTRVLPGALDELVKFLENHLGAGAAGSRLLNPDGSLQHSCSPLPTLVSEGMHLFHLDYRRRRAMRDWDVNRPRQVDVLLGACLLVRREALEHVGVLDEGYFMYSEEVDFCRRLQEAAWTLHWVPQSQIVHYGGQSTRQLATAMFLRLYASKLRYFRKHDGAATGRVYKAILLAGAVFRLVVLPAALFLPRTRRVEEVALARRYFKLILSLPRY